jgi:hypothetical protein
VGREMKMIELKEEIKKDEQTIEELNVKIKKKAEK